MSDQLKQPRQSNIELFRIVTMLLIVAHHYVVNSGISESVCSQPAAIRSVFLLLFGAWGKAGINGFVLITGYFMCKSKITLRKFMRLLLEVMFYRLLIWALFLIAGYETFSVKALILKLLPIKYVSDGFTEAYLLFFLCIPFLNILLHNLNRKQHLYLLLLLGFIYVLLGAVQAFYVRMNYVSWFIVVYFVGAFLRMYGGKWLQKTGLWTVTTGVLILAASAAVVFRAHSAIDQNRNMPYFYQDVIDSNKPLALALAVSTFLLFNSLKMPRVRWINTMAESCFGVLLIHAQSDAMRKFLWQELLRCPESYQLPAAKLLLHAFGSVLGVFLICTVLDQLRIRLLERPLFRRLEIRFPALK